MHNAFGVSDDYHFFPNDEYPPSKINKFPLSKSDKSTKGGANRGVATVYAHL